MNLTRQLITLGALATHNRYEAYEAHKKYEQSNREMRRLEQEFRVLNEHCQRLEHARARTSAELISATRAYGALATFKEKLEAQERRVKSDLGKVSQLQSKRERLEEKVRCVKRAQAEITSSAQLEDMTLLTHQPKGTRKDSRTRLSRGQIGSPGKATLSQNNSFRLASLKQSISNQAFVGKATSVDVTRGENIELSVHSPLSLEDSVSGEDLSLLDESLLDITNQELVDPELAAESELSNCGSEDLCLLSADLAPSSSTQSVTNDESSTGSGMGNDLFVKGSSVNSPSLKLGQEGLNSSESVQPNEAKFRAHSDLHDQNQRHERDTLEVHDSQSITLQVKNSKIKITNRQGNLTGKVLSGQDISDAKVTLLLQDS